jgi:hypothetical protein
MDKFESEYTFTDNTNLNLHGQKNTILPLEFKQQNLTQDDISRSENIEKFFSKDHNFLEQIRKIEELDCAVELIINSSNLKILSQMLIFI